jgi:hypothetical protein
MFRPPPDYHWRCSKNKYEKQFRRKAPQWALTLDRGSGRTLFLACWDDKPCYRLDGAAHPPGRADSKK